MSEENRPKNEKIQEPGETEENLEVKETRQEEREEKPGAHDLKNLKNKLKKRESEIKTLKKDIEELKEKYVRILAEMENLRKRLERDKNDYYQYALSDVLRDLLTILDNFERALENRDHPDGKSFQEGVEMIYKQYADLLRKKGVIPIEMSDKKFDPNIHQAFITEESEEVEEPEVSEELQKGYTLHNRLLRPALVKVRVPKKR